MRPLIVAFTSLSALSCASTAARGPSLARGDLPEATPPVATRLVAGAPASAVLDARREEVLALYESFARALYERSTQRLRPLLGDSIGTVGAESPGSAGGALLFSREIVLGAFERALQSVEPPSRPFPELYRPPAQVRPLEAFTDNSAPSALRPGDWYVQGDTPRMLRATAAPGLQAVLPATLQLVVRWTDDGPRVVAVAEQILRARP